MSELLKVKPPPEYPPENGNYLRGNDFSPVAVAVILTSPYEEIPSEVERLVRTAIKTGVALAGTLQTANIGIEKIIVNIVSNPNIRYLILVGNESRGHYPGDAFKALMVNGTDSKGNIIGTKAQVAHVTDIPSYIVGRFREQVTLIDLLDTTDPELLRKAICATYQERPVEFEVNRKKYILYDQGALPKEPIVYKLTDKLRQKLYQLFKAEIFKATKVE
ncbi:MAG: tetrahydromethanopterin S-methyltransferase subunit A [Nitrososphaerales archaeon]